MNNKKRVALITGITGQDGAYLAKLLLEKNYVVYGTSRNTINADYWRLKELGILTHLNLKLVDLDLANQKSCVDLISYCNPHEVYNLATQSFVNVSFEQPLATAQITAIGVLNLLEAIRLVNTEIKFYQASTSEMFGATNVTPQDENTAFTPNNPYAVAKLYGHWITTNYRDIYGIFGCSGIMFNHESPLRDPKFVTRKITSAIAKIKYGLQDVLELGNIDTVRDWGFAGEYVECMWRMLQLHKSDTYVLATNRAESVRKFLQLAFQCAEMDVEFSGTGVNEIAVNKKTNAVVMRINPKFYRPAKPTVSIGNSAKTKRQLGWEAKITLEKLCHMMVTSDLQRIMILHGV